MQNEFKLEDYLPTEFDIIKRTLDTKLNQELVLTKIKDEHNKFLTYNYFDADVFLGQVSVYKAQRNIVDEYSEQLYNYFLILAELKNEKEQENNHAWINNDIGRVRPDIFNASLSGAVVSILEQKLMDLRSEENPLFQLQYVNYTQRLNQNMACIENVEHAKNSSLIKKMSKPCSVWKKAVENNTSVNKIQNDIQIQLR